MYRFLTVFVIAGLCSASQINVPSDYPTIGAAVAAAVSGDTVVLADGIYQGPGNRDIVIGEDKTIIIKSANGPQNCVIDCGGSAEENHFAFQINGKGAVIDGLTITGCYAAENSAVHVDAELVTIRNCIIRNNYGGLGISALQGVHIVGCLIADNGGIYRRFENFFDSQIEFCTIVNISNSVHIYLLESSIKNTIIWSKFQETSFILPDDLSDKGNFIQRTNSPDPQFVDFENGDYRLKGSSPCIDAAIDIDDSLLGYADIDGTVRGVGLRSDCGAYEYHNPMDINFDGPTDIQDYSMLAGLWLDEYFHDDLVSLAANWLNNYYQGHQRAFWKFENPDSLVVKDYLDCKHDGVLMGGAQIIQDDERGSVLYLNGIDGYMKAPGFKGTGGGCRVSFWMKLPYYTDAVPAFSQGLFCWGKREPTSVFKISLNHVQGRNYSTINLDTNGRISALSTKWLADNQWHKIILEIYPKEVSPRYVSVLVDSQSVGKFDITDTPMIPDEDFILGRNFGDTNPMYFKGWIDDFMVTDGFYVNPDEIFNKDKIYAELDFDNLADPMIESSHNYPVIINGYIEPDIGSVVGEVSYSDYNQTGQYKGILFSGTKGYISVSGYKGIAGMSKRVVSMEIAPLHGGGALVSWGEPKAGGRWMIFVDESTSKIGIGLFDQSVVTQSVPIGDNKWHSLIVILPESPLPTLNDIIVIVDGNVYMVDYNFAPYSAYIINTSSANDVLIGAVVGTGGITNFYNGAIRNLVIADDFSDIFYPQYSKLWLPLDSIKPYSSPDLSPYKRIYTIYGIPYIDLDPTIGYFAGFKDNTQIYLENKGISDYNPRSITGWIRTHDTEGEIIGWGDKTIDGAKWLVRTCNIPGTPTDEGVLRAEIVNGWIMGSTNICDNQWHHIAVVQEFAYMPFTRLYIDGHLDAISLKTPQWINTKTSTIDSTYIGIGGFADYSPRYFEGDMAKLKIYSRALAANEVYEQYLEYANK